MVSVLMIDDDTEFCAMLREFLGSYQIEVVAAYDAHSGLAALRRNGYDLVLLDVMLPDADGLDMLTEIRRTARIPVLVLSAEGSEARRIEGLDRGADDYLGKPFNPRELVSRIHAILRRLDPHSPNAGSDRSAQTGHAGFSFDCSAKQAFYRGERLPLTGVEFELLNLLAHSPGKILEREILVSRVFQRPFNPLDRSLDMHISRLRRKLSSVLEFEAPIKTIRSSGYVFSPEETKYTHAASHAV